MIDQKYPNHLEEVDINNYGVHFVFDVVINGWYLCVEGEWDTPPEEWFLSGAWTPRDDPISSMFMDVIRDALDNAFNYDNYTIGKEVAELVLAAPVHEWKDST